MTPLWIPAVDEETGQEVMLWDGGGRIVNDEGDLYGNAPHRIIRSGSLVIEKDRAPAGIAVGWRVVEKPADLECDDDFVWLTRTEDERGAA